MKRKKKKLNCCLCIFISTPKWYYSVHIVLYVAHAPHATSVSIYFKNIIRYYYERSDNFFSSSFRFLQSRNNFFFTFLFSFVRNSFFLSFHCCLLLFEFVLFFYSTSFNDRFNDIILKMILLDTWTGINSRVILERTLLWKIDVEWEIFSRKTAIII